MRNGKKKSGTKTAIKKVDVHTMAFSNFLLSAGNEKLFFCLGATSSL
jgi:hypothetical protein